MKGIAVAVCRSKTAVMKQAALNISLYYSYSCLAPFTFTDVHFFEPPKALKICISQGLTRQKLQIGPVFKVQNVMYFSNMA